jgi:hypothetical protein
MKIKLTTLSILLTIGLFAQVGEEKTEYKKSYMATASEFILSMGNLGNAQIYAPNPLGGVQIPISDKASSPVPRFSAFFHFTQQMHYNFSSGLGMYTGIGLRNIGMINNLNDTIRVKHRAYGISVPLAFKMGNMGKKSYFALGAEAEYMFHFKQKVFVGEGRGDKQNKTSEWFSNRLSSGDSFVTFCGPACWAGSLAPAASCSKALSWASAAVSSFLSKKPVTKSVPTTVPTRSKMATTAIKMILTMGDFFLPSTSVSSSAMVCPRWVAVRPGRPDHHGGL